MLMKKILFIYRVIVAHVFRMDSESKDCSSDSTVNIKKRRTPRPFSIESIMGLNSDTSTDLEESTKYKNKNRTEGTGLNHIFLETLVNCSSPEDIIKRSDKYRNNGEMTTNDAERPTEGPEPTQTVNIPITNQHLLYPVPMDFNQHLVNSYLCNPMLSYRLPLAPSHHFQFIPNPDVLVPYLAPPLHSPGGENESDDSRSNSRSPVSPHDLTTHRPQSGKLKI